MRLPVRKSLAFGSMVAAAAQFSKKSYEAEAEAGGWVTVVGEPPVWSDEDPKEEEKKVADEEPEEPVEQESVAQESVPEKPVEPESVTFVDGDGDTVKYFLRDGKIWSQTNDTLEGVVTSFSYEKETGKLMDNFGEMTLPGVNRDQILAKLKDLTSASGTPLESA